MIGNGFDLEHKLPTSYKDFLEFCDKARRIYTFSETAPISEYQRNNLDDWKMDTSVKEMLLSAFKERKLNKALQEDGTYVAEVTTPNKLLDELYTQLRNNTWLDYFLHCPSYIGENWIDFEAEISRVIQALGCARFQVESGGDVTNVDAYKSKILAAIWKSSKKNLRDAFKDIASIDRFAGFLDNELERLIRALEIYIAEIVNNISISQKSSDIGKINPNHVLSFNYSDTYERIYGVGKSIAYDYIHGKADITKNINTCNLVLGIDEYLDDGRKDEELEFLTFKKYYQRIYKSTGNAYLDWADKIKMDDAEYHRKVSLAYTGEPDPLYSFPGQKRYYLDVSSIKRPEHKLYIFGHSLDVTDKDVLKLFICNDNVQTKIFYHRKSRDDKTALGKLIKNLVKIIGQDELIRRTGGACKTIEFIPQTLSNDEQ